MASRIVRLGPFKPGLPTLEAGGSTVVTNALPSVKGYKPLRSLEGLTSSIGAPALGAVFAKASNGETSGVAGTTADLFALSGSTGQWASSSRSDGYATAAGERWRFAQFGDTLVATNYSDEIQALDLAVGGSWADLNTDDAPRARYIATVREFLFTLNIVDQTGTKPNRARWSAQGDPGSWPLPGTVEAKGVLSDKQDFNDLGEGRGIVAGLTSGDVALFFDNGVVVGIFRADPDIIFQFDTVEGARGLAAPDSLIKIGGEVFYLGPDDFYLFNGTTSTAIGNTEIADFFFRNVDQSNIGLTVGAASPFSKKLFWFYVGVNSTDGSLDSALCFDREVNEWASIEGVKVQCLTTAVSPGFSIEDMDEVAQSLDEIPGSLDDRIYAGGGLPDLAAFNEQHQLALFSGEPLAARIETDEYILTAGRRSTLVRVRPMVDGVAPTVRVITRDKGSALAVTHAPQTVNQDGAVLPRVPGRFHRVRFDFPAGAAWTDCQGMELEFQPAGYRAPGVALAADTPADFLRTERGEIIRADDGGKVRVA